MANTDLFGNLPPEIEAEQLSIRRKQALAEAMIKRGMTPAEGGMVGRYYVPPSPLEGIAQLVNAYMGSKQLGEADKAYSALGGKYQKGVSDAMMDYQRQKTGTPGLEGVESPPDEIGGGPGRDAVAAVPGNPRAAVESAMMNPYLKNNPMISADLKSLQPTTLGRSMVVPATGEVTATDATWTQEQQEARKAREDAAVLAREAKKAELEAKLADAKASREEKAAAQRELAQMRADFAREAARDRAANRQPAAAPAVTPVTIQDPNDPNKTIIIDGRTRAVLGAGPKLTEGGKLDQKRAFNMTGLNGVIQEAEDILSGVKRSPDGVTTPADTPTGSGIGTVVDMVGGVFGRSPSGAVEAQKLKAVSGALVSKMPRMEGPQSDKDVLLYKEMAAEVGNSSVPIDRRKAALQTVKDLWAKYETKQTGGPGGQPPKPIWRPGTPPPPPGFKPD